MGVSGQGLRRLALLAAAFALAGCAAGPSRSQPAGAPGVGDCVAITVWSNGYHTSLALPGEAFPAGHPIRALFPEASHFLIGFGDQAFYQAEEPGVADALRASLSPTPGVLHVIAGDAPVEEGLWPARETVPVAISRAGLAAIARDVEESLALAPLPDGTGAAGPIIVGPGRAPGASLFLSARQRFHLFHMCNHWTAERLAAAGAPLRPPHPLQAGALLEEVRARAPAHCPIP